MDWRNRDYYLCKLPYHANDAIEYIKFIVPSAKLSSPYNHFNHDYSTKGNKWTIGIYDGCFMDVTDIKIPACMISCIKSESEQLEDTFNRMIESTYMGEHFIKYFKLSKEVCGQ